MPSATTPLRAVANDLAASPFGFGNFPRPLSESVSGFANTVNSFYILCDPRRSYMQHMCLLSFNSKVNLVPQKAAPTDPHKKVCPGTGLKFIRPPKLSLHIKCPHSRPLRQRLPKLRKSRPLKPRRVRPGVRITGRVLPKPTHTETKNLSTQLIYHS